MLLAGGKPKAQTSLPQKSSELFQATKVWTVHLKLTPEAWTEMEPKGGQGGFFGGPPPPPGGGGRPGGVPPPNGGGRPGGGPPEGGFGPSMFIAPAFMGQSDKDKDGKISEAEFRQMAEGWYAKIDKDKKSIVDEKQLRKGLNLVLTSPPPGGGGGQGGGAPPAFSLQGRPGFRNGVAGAMGIEFKQVHADLEFEGETFPDIALRYKGNGTFLESRASIKRSLKIDLKKYVKGRELAGVTTLNLHNNVTDISSMNEPLALRAFRDSGIPAPRTAYAKVYVTVPGKYDHKYFGLYSLVENVDKNFVQDRFKTKKGALLKPSSPNLFAYLGEDWKAYEQTYEPKTDLTEAQKRKVIDFCKLVTSAKDEEFAKRIGEFVSLDDFAKYMATLVWILDLDSVLDMGQNFFMHLHPKTDRFQFIAWDQDHSFGTFGMMGKQEDRENLNIHKPWMGEKRFLERMYKLDAFKKPYLASLSKLTNGLLKPERIAQQVDELGKVLRPAVQEESEPKLANFDKMVAGKPVKPASSFGPFKMPDTVPIKPFVKARALSIAGQLAGKVEGKSLGMGFGPPGGDNDFGPGMFLTPAFMKALDTNKDKKVSREEFLSGFAKWFTTWNSDKSGFLTDKQLRSGIDKALAPDFSNMDFGGGGDF